MSTSGKAFAGGAAGRGAARSVACNGKAAWKTAIDVMNKELMVKESVFEQAMAIKGVDAWPEWESEVKEFPWSYDQHEEAYITEGAGTVTPDGGEPVDIKAGDFVTFPKGMSCTWDVTKVRELRGARGDLRGGGGVSEEISGGGEGGRCSAPQRWSVAVEAF